ncbi:MAG TPA: insulinase family protein [Caulobacteraceae bacterium]|nr:insulinase family protein [Caulobacteraceae bacterium]
MRGLYLAAALAVSSLAFASVSLAQNAGSPTARHAGGQAAASGNGNTVRDLSAVQPDPAVRSGVLPNGMHYAVMSGGAPARGISFRFHVNTGSYEEHDDERGVAHFLEHMAFNGGRNIPGGQLDKLFGAQGVLFGRDQNAETGLFGTTYELDIPEVDKAKLDLAFGWLRDIADGLTLDPAAVDRERGVVLSEDNRSRGPARTWGEAVQKFLAPELRSTDHDPLGSRESIKSIDAAKLRNFYQRWYRPDQAIVVVVGDLPVDELEKRVVDTFSSWKPIGAEPPRVPISKPNLSRPFEVLNAAQPYLPASVDLCFGRADDEEIPDTVARARLLLERRLWRDVLNERLRTEAGSDTPPFGRAEVGEHEADKEALYSCLDVLPLKNDWRGGLDAALTEVRRLQAHGATSDEVGRALEGIRAEYRAAADSSRATPSAVLAERLMNEEVNGDVLATPRERFRILDRADAGLTERDIDTAFNRDWAGSGPYLIVSTPDGVDAAAVKAAYTEDMSGAVPPPLTAVKAATWAYADFGPAGKVANRSEVANPGFVRVTFANGVVLNFKRLTASQDKIEVRVRFGAGRREIPNKDYYAAELGSQLFVEGGLGKHDAETLRRLFNDHGWGAEFNILDDAFVLQGATNPTDLDVEMQILGAFVTDPGFHKAIDAKLPTAVDLMERAAKTSPEFAASQALNRAVAPNGVYVTPPRDELLAINSSTFERLFKPALTQAPLEVTIVGDVTEDHAVDAVARTLGALPPRTATDRVRPDTFFLRYPKTAPPIIHTTYESSEDKAVVSLLWPLYVAEPKRRREEYALNVVAQVMDDAIRHRVRTQMGKSYAPQVGMASPDDADQGAINALIETTATDANAVAEAARDTTADIAAHGVTQEAFDAARKPMLDAIPNRMEDIDWWEGGLDGSAGNFEILREFIDYKADMESVTLEDVNRYAKIWLSQTPIIVIATPAPPTSTASVGAKAPAER